MRIIPVKVIPFGSYRQLHTIPPYFDISKRRDFLKTIIEHKICVLICFDLKHINRRNERGAGKSPLVLSDLSKTRFLSTHLRNILKYQI